MKPLLLTTLLLALSAGAAAQPGAGRQDAAALRQSVEQFLQTQTAGLPGQARVTVGAIDARMALPACPAPQACVMPGSRAWGKTTVGVRCGAPVWTIYVQANVSVVADYIASAVPLAQGQTIEAGQLVAVQGDLTAMPPGIATDMAQVVGRYANVSLPSGTPLRLDTLKSRPVVQQSMLGWLVWSGDGLSVSGGGRGVSTAGGARVVQVRTSCGQQSSGIAKAGGLVEVAF